VAAGGDPAKGASHASESSYREVFNAIDQAFHRCEVIVDAAGRAVDYRLLEVNRAWARMTGMDPVAAVGRTARELVPDAPEAWIQACGRAGLARESVRLEQEIPALGMWYDVHLMPFGPPEGRQFLATAADITARKRAEAERERLTADVAAERERLRDVLLQAPTPMALLVGPEHRFELVNDAYRRVSGGGRDVTGLTFREAYPELEGQPFFDIQDRVYATGEPWAASAVPVRYDRLGTGIEDTFFDLRYEPVRDGEGRVFAILNYGVDVTDQVRARREVERLLAESERARAAAVENEARYRAVFDAMDEGYLLAEVLFDDEGRPVDLLYVEANPAAVRMTRTEYVGRRLLEIDPTFEPYWLQIWGRVARTGVGERLERYAAPLATWFDFYVTRVGGAGSRRVAVVFQDVTARKRAEAERVRLLAELGAERERLRAVILHMPAPLALLVGPEHRFELVNDAYKRVSGGGRDVTGLTPPEAFPELAGSGTYELFDRVYETGEPWDGPETLCRYDRDGTGVIDTWFDLRFEPMRDADGRVTAVLNFAVDVTEQVLARRSVERLLAESERARAEADAAHARAVALQGVTAALAEARTLDDVAAVVVGAMARAAGARAGSLAVPTADGDALRLVRVFGFPDAVRPTIAVQPLDLASPIPACFRTGDPIWAERRGGPDGMDARYPAVAHAWAATGVESGAYLPLHVAGRIAGVIAYAFGEPHGFGEGERAFLLALGRQVAVAVERARLWDAEHAARAEAERANRAKSEFLATMSHELRTPLNAIGGYAELIELGIHGPVTEAQRTALERIQRSQRHLLGLIAGVLDYSRVEAGAVSYRLLDVPVAEVVAEAEALVAPQLRAKGLGYAWSGAAPGLAVRADREKLQQILLNLLGNAVKFTDARDGVPGRIEVTCAGALAEGPGEGSGRVAIRVRDTGEGIAPEELERIFEPFVQADQRLTRPHAGVGLGLAISRDLARGMGGELTAESTPGVGSTFTLVLPRA
jgi:PAS domain S-box-containing protein